MDRIVLVTKPSRLDDLIRKHHTQSTVKFLLESQGQSMETYTAEHEAYENAIGQIRKGIPIDIPVVLVSRENLPNTLFRENDLIIACGPDGLFANLAQYVQKQLVLTINPDKKTVAGILMLFEPSEVGEVVKKIKANNHKVESLPFVKATVDNDKVLWGINDIFIGRRDHVSARYELSFVKKSEHQSSSGLLVSTGIGSTGWMRSLQTMVRGLSGTNGGTIAKLPTSTDTELVFAVREPFPSPNTGTSIITGRILPEQPLVVTSEMPNGGYLFSDGIVEKGIIWNAGSIVKVSVGDRYINRIVK